jgi:hypothetical protein
MGEPVTGYELTAEERHAIVLLRRGPQSLHGLAETLGLNPEQGVVKLTCFNTMTRPGGGPLHPA